MKKNIITSLVAVILGGASCAIAAPVEVEFVGNVTAVTCDLGVVVDGVNKNQIDLGSVAKGAEGPAKKFYLKSVSGQVCDLAKRNSVLVSWDGNFDMTGLRNGTGTASGAVMQLSAGGDATGTKIINQSNKVNTFPLANSGQDTAALPLDGLEYSATLDATAGTATEGSYIATARYVVSYN
ncbi:TPA: hypothetical protein IGZ61_005125 [Escherichia coli]|nr:hypothetical protein [Escherichia coli]